MREAPEIVFVVGNPTDDDRAHLSRPSALRTFCREPVLRRERRLPLARSKWPIGARCERCFRDA